jgi:hypothetical protein
LPVSSFNSCTIVFFALGFACRASGRLEAWGLQSRSHQGNLDSVKLVAVFVFAFGFSLFAFRCICIRVQRAAVFAFGCLRAACSVKRVAEFVFAFGCLLAACRVKRAAEFVYAFGCLRSACSVKRAAEFVFAFGCFVFCLQLAACSGFPFRGVSSAEDCK